MLESNEWVPGIAPDVIKAAKEDEAREKKEAAKVIEDIGEDFSLFSWGYSDELKTTRAGKVEYKRLKLKSVGVQEIMESYQKSMPSPPSVKRTIKKNSPEAKELGYQHDIIITQVDESDAEYRRMKSEHDNAAGQEILLRGLMYDLKFNGQVVLKGADPTQPTEILDKVGAMKALKRMGLTAEHFSSIVKSIRELTADSEVEETGES